MNCPTTGSINEGFNFFERVCDIIDRYNFPEKVKEDAKRILFDLDNRHHSHQTALISLYISSQFNNYDFKGNVNNILDVYESKGKKLKKTSRVKTDIVSKIKKKSTEYEIDNTISCLEKMYRKLENARAFPKEDPWSYALSSPNR